MLVSLEQRERSIEEKLRGEYQQRLVAADGVKIQFRGCRAGHCVLRNIHCVLDMAQCSRAQTDVQGVCRCRSHVRDL